MKRCYTFGDVEKVCYDIYEKTYNLPEGERPNSYGLASIMATINQVLNKLANMEDE